MSKKNKLIEQFPFINHTALRKIVYNTARNQKIRIGNTVFDRKTYKTNPHLVLDTLAKDALALETIGHFHKQLNKKRALYYPYFNRTLSKREIREIEQSKNQKVSEPKQL